MNKNKLNKCHYNRFQHLIVMTAILQFHDTILSVIVAGNGLGLTEKRTAPSILGNTVFITRKQSNN